MRYHDIWFDIVYVDFEYYLYKLQESRSVSAYSIEKTKPLKGYEWFEIGSSSYTKILNC